jgi:BatD DUF11 like domain
MKSFKYFLFSLFFFNAVSIAIAQKFTATVNKKNVAVGEIFQLTFQIEGEAKNFRAPSLKDFSVYSGPNTTQSVSIVNGNMTQSIGFNYILLCNKEGKFVIGPASVETSKGALQTQSITIESSKNGGSNSKSGNNESQEEDQLSKAKGQSFKNGNDDLFVKTIVSKTKAFVGEQITVTYKIYTTLNLKGFADFKLPAYNGFWASEFNRNRQINVSFENIDGLNYSVATFNQSFICPQRAGKLEIEPIEIECIVQQRSKNGEGGFFEEFFGMAHYENISYKIKSKVVKIESVALPTTNQPANFSGAVGEFTYKAQLDKESLKANESVNLKVKISGSGNLKLIDPPKPKLHQSFEIYDPKVTDNVSSNADGMTGSKTIDYLFIPRQAGDFEIEDLSFSYFDPKTQKYVVIPAPELNVKVSPGAAGSENANPVIGSTVSEIAAQKNDIHFIRTDNIVLTEKATLFFNSWKHLSILMSIAVLGLLIGIIIKIYRKSTADNASNRVKKAASMARKQLSKAELLMKKNDKPAFYNEVLNALNNYSANKLQIPVADLSKDKITEYLEFKKVNHDLIKQLNQNLELCQMANYAPGMLSDNLGEVYNSTETLINELENALT